MRPKLILVNHGFDFIAWTVRRHACEEAVGQRGKLIFKKAILQSNFHHLGGDCFVTTPVLSLSKGTLLAAPLHFGGSMTS